MKTSRNPAPSQPQVLHAPFERNGGGSTPRGLLKVLSDMADTGLTTSEKAFAKQCIRRMQAVEHLEQMVKNARAEILADIERVPAANFLKSAIVVQQN